jgi:FkbM family methyltransferase
MVNPRAGLNVLQLFKGAVKGCASALGYDIRPRHALGRGIGVTIEHIFRLGFKPGTVIDVGVADGTPELYRQFPQAHHLLIEPLSEWEPDLQAIVDKYDAEYVLAAAGSAPGTMTINVHKDPSSSSPLFEQEGSLADGVPRHVPVVTVDMLCAARQLAGPYLMKIDVQGGELAVLEGARMTLRETELLFVEVSLFRFFVGGPQFLEVAAWMQSHGFVPYDFGGGHCRPVDGALAQMDVAFVKENGRFRQSHSYATPSQREAMYGRSNRVSGRAMSRT